jgi:hypothetical protein
VGAWRTAIGILGGVLALAVGSASNAWAEDQVAGTPSGAGALSSDGTYFRTTGAQPTLRCRRRGSQRMALRGAPPA